MAEDRRGWIAVGAGCAIAALWLDFSQLHAQHTSDSLLSVLVSLQQWTAFYWEQDRFGMLLPLLAAPVREPVANLLVQTYLQLLATLLAPFLALRLAGFRGAPCIVGGALGLATLFVTVDPHHAAWLVFYPVGLSISLAAVSVELLESRRAARVVLGAAVTLVALWVNVGLLFLVPPLVVLRRALAPEPGERWRALVVPAAVWGGAAGLVRLAMRLWGQRATRLNPEWPSAWPHAWAMLGRHALDDYGAVFFGCVAAACAVLVGVSIVRHEVPERRKLAAVGLAGLFFWLAVGANRHVADNAFHSRYVSAVFLLFPGALWAAAASRLRFPAVGLAAAVLVIVSGAFRFGFPSPGLPRALLEQRFAAAEREARALGCTHVVGDYWTAWPLELMSLVTHARDPAQPVIWAVAYRAGPTARQWKAVVPPKWCATAGDAGVDAVLKQYELNPVVSRERVGAFDVLQLR